MGRSCSIFILHEFQLTQELIHSQPALEMAALNDLTDELMLGILGLLANDRSNLRSLCYVNKRFGSLAVHELARNVKIDVQSHNEGMLQLGKHHADGLESVNTDCLSLISPL